MWFLSRMSPHMLSQRPGHRERLAARLTDVRSLPRMCPHVYNQVTGLGEHPVARLADIRPLPRMRPHVPSQVAALGVSIATRLADILLLPRMRPHVHSQVVRRRERLAAHLALEAARYRTRVSFTPLAIPRTLHDDLIRFDRGYFVISGAKPMAQRAKPMAQIPVINVLKIPSDLYV
jgi:hypothetical protein